jgi:hypothetical protein
VHWEVGVFKEDSVVVGTASVTIALCSTTSEFDLEWFNKVADSTVSSIVEHHVLLKLKISGSCCGYRCSLPVWGRKCQGT